MEDKKAYVEEYCTACHKPLPPNALFCKSCGPPIPPPRTPERILSPTQAIIRIVSILAVFLLIVSIKMDFSWSSLFSSTENSSVQSEDTTQAEDYKVIHYVKVDRANVRVQPTTESDVITVMAKGERVVVLEKTEEWAKVDLQGKMGYIAVGLLTAKVE